MKQFTQELHSKLLKSIQKVSMVSPNNIQRVQHAYREAEKIMNELKAFINSYSFSNKEEEILFFKTIKPKFTRELIYYAELVKIEMFRPAGSLETQQSYNKKIMDRINIFFERNQLLYDYYRMDKTEYDEQMFLRGSEGILFYPECQVVMDLQFCTVCGYKLGKIQAFEQVVRYLQTEPNSVQSNSSNKPDDAMQVTWTDSKAALIELAYAIHAKGSVNFGKNYLQQIVNVLEAAFQIELGNVYRTYYDMSIRKKSRTPYLDGLKTALEQRMDDGDWLK